MLDQLKIMYTSIQGRISRLMFFTHYFVIASLVAMMIRYVIGLMIQQIVSLSLEEAMIVSSLVQAIVSLGVFYYTIPLVIKRSHDLDQDGKARVTKLWYIYIAIHVLTVIGLAMMYYVPDLINSPIAALLIIVVCAFLIFERFYLHRSLIFKKGTIGTNQYGPDPIKHHS